MVAPRLRPERLDALGIFVATIFWLEFKFCIKKELFDFTHHEDLALLHAARFGGLFISFLGRSFRFALEKPLLEDIRFEALLFADAAERLIEARHTIGLAGAIGFDATSQTVHDRLTFRW